MIEIDVTDPKLDWNDYTSDELVNAKLVAPRAEGANFTKADIDAKAQAESDLRDHMSPEDQERRIQVQWNQAKMTIDAARKALNSMGSIRKNLNVLQNVKPFTPTVKPMPNIDMDKLIRSITNQQSQQLHVKVSPEGALTTTPINDDEVTATTPELTEPEQALIREAQTISGSEVLSAIVTHVEAVSATLTEQKEEGEKQARFNRRGTIISIVVATLSLILAITTACITLFGPAPTIESPADPIPVEVVEPTNE